MLKPSTIPSVRPMHFGNDSYSSSHSLSPFQRDLGFWTRNQELRSSSIPAWQGATGRLNSQRALTHSCNRLEQGTANKKQKNPARNQCRGRRRNPYTHATNLNIPELGGPKKKEKKKYVRSKQGVCRWDQKRWGWAEGGEGGMGGGGSSSSSSRGSPWEIRAKVA